VDLVRTVNNNSTAVLTDQNYASMVITTEPVVMLIEWRQPANVTCGCNWSVIILNFSLQRSKWVV